MAVIIKHWEANSKIWLLEYLTNKVVSVSDKFEGCATKIVGGVGLFSVTGFFEKAPLPISAARLPV